MTARRHLRDLCPPVFLTWLKRMLGYAPRYVCGYSSWDAATADAAGYDDPAILARVVSATRQVVAGEGAYERDSVLFERLDCPFQILVPLLKAAAESSGRVVVLDYGGSLGSTYRQCRPFLGRIALAWHVVEQSSYVAAGRAEFESDELKFHERIEDVAAQPDVALFSSSLQYLPRPYDALRSAAARGCRYLVIDRTPLVAGVQDHVCVQHVPRSIYASSYPFRVLARDRVLAAVAGDWSVFADYVAPEGAAKTKSGLAFEFRGLILQRNDA